MTKYIYRILCASLAFTLGVAITPTLSPTVVSTKTEVTPKFSLPDPVWPEPRTLDSELTDDGELSYRGYTIKRLYKKVKVHYGPNEPMEFSYATLIHNGKTLARFDRGSDHPMGNETSFGLVSLLKSESKQLLIAEYSWRNGSHWIVNLAPFQVIYNAADWGTGGDAIHVLDLDSDGVEEILGSVAPFYSLHNKLAISQIPMPGVIFKYDTQTTKYLPANTLHDDYLLRNINKWKESVSEPAKNNFDHRAEVLRIALQFVYAGKEKEGWEFFENTYRLPDKGEIKTGVLAILKDEPVYQFIRTRQGACV